MTSDIKVLVFSGTEKEFLDYKKRNNCDNTIRVLSPDQVAGIKYYDLVTIGKWYTDSDIADLYFNLKSKKIARDISNETSTSFEP